MIALIKKISLLLLMTLSLATYGANEPLKVGISYFSPPFVMQVAHKNFHGFDISMMSYICKNLQRNCQFIPMRFDQLITAVQTKSVDVAISAITITPERSKTINFSLPYLPSYSRFLALTKNNYKPFRTSLLENKTIGVEQGTVFVAQINNMALKNITIKSYEREDDMIDALNKGLIDLALLDDPEANYWQNHSFGALKTIGKPQLYGFGYGIVLNINDTQLTKDINTTLLQYQAGVQFKQDYQIYLSSF